MWMSRKITEKVLAIDKLPKFVNGGKWIEVTPRPFFFGSLGVLSQLNLGLLVIFAKNK